LSTVCASVVWRFYTCDPSHAKEAAGFRVGDQIIMLGSEDMAGQRHFQLAQLMKWLPICNDRVPVKVFRPKLSYGVYAA